MPEDQDLQDLFKRAAAVAESVPAALQEAAFNRALDALLHPNGDTGASSRRDGSSRGSRQPGKARSGDDGGSDPVQTLLTLSRDQAESVDDAEGALGKALALLHVAETKAGISALTAPQIAQVLTTKFKWKVTRQAITQALDRAGKMVDSTTGDGARAYTIMQAGVQYLETPAEERQAGTARQTTPRRPAKRGARKATATNAEPKPANGSSSQRKQSTREGPRASVEALISRGFFSTPRLLGDIKNELKDSRGLVYKSTDLSPVLTRLLRDGILSRARNADSQYEYVSN